MAYNNQTFAKGQPITAEMIDYIDDAVDRLDEIVEQIMLSVYPVGSIYLSANNTNPSTLFGGAWELISQDRCLMGASNNHRGGTTVEAGLPNITGTFPASLEGGGTFKTSGAFGVDTKGYFGWGIDGKDYDNYGLNFNASRCSGVYGNSNTVQPPAYYVYVWKRTA